jgi:hypothetical protein
VNSIICPCPCHHTNYDVDGFDKTVHIKTITYHKGLCFDCDNTFPDRKVINLEINEAKDD